MRCAICGDGSPRGGGCYRCGGRQAGAGREYAHVSIPIQLDEEDLLPGSPSTGQEIRIDRRAARRPIEEEPWEDSLAACYREAAGGSHVIETCAEKLEAAREVRDPWWAEPGAAKEPEGGEGVGAAESWGAFESEERGWADAESRDPLPVATATRGSEGLWLRQGLSWATDGAILAVMALLVSLRAGRGPELAAFMGIAAFVYLTLSCFLGGRTLGDRLAGLRTVEAEGGGAPALGTAALRSLVGVLGGAILVGFLWSIFDGEGRTLHDRLSGTERLREIS